MAAVHASFLAKDINKGFYAEPQKIPSPKLMNI